MTAQKAAANLQNAQTIQRLTQQIALLQAQIAQLTAEQTPSATDTSDATQNSGSPEVNATLGVHLNVYAFPRPSSAINGMF